MKDCKPIDERIKDRFDPYAYINCKEALARTRVLKFRRSLKWSVRILCLDSFNVIVHLVGVAPARTKTMSALATAHTARNLYDY